jgi:hypothetical protein
MKMGEPIYPITNNHGCKTADVQRVGNKAIVKFPYGSYDGFTIADLEGIIDLMKKKELDWCAEPQPSDRE